MKEDNKIPPIVIDGNVIELDELTVEELELLKQKIEQRQAEIRKKIYNMLEE